MKLILSFTLFVFPFFCLASENAGKTAFARGKVEASNSSETRGLKRRSPVFIEDTVATGVDSGTQLRMIDGGLLTLQHESLFVINNYEFNSSTLEGDVNLNLVKGGLRALTGALKANKDRYQLKTPVASIGVRGTHYEAELVEGDLFLGVWQGNIDVEVTVGSEPLLFSLGDNENYRFAIVRKNGEVDYILSVPTAFTDGHSSSMTVPATAINSGLSAQEKGLLARPLTEQTLIKHRYISDEDGEFDYSGDGLIDNDLNWSDITPEDPEIIASRSGQVVFDNLLEHSLHSSQGGVDNVSMSLTVNFDTARVSEGILSFNDSQGEWFAAFDGIFTSAMLEVNVNFASHGNALAQGELNGFFLNNGEKIFGEVVLFEVDDPNVTAGGGFILSEQP